MEKYLTIETLKLSKSKKEVLIIFDDKSLLKIPLDIVFKYRLKKGITLTPDTLNKIQKEAKIFSAQRLAYQKATSSLKSRKQLKQILQNKGFLEDEIELAIAKLEELKIIDDKKYAQSVADYLSNKKKYGINRIRQYLVQKGVAKNIIENVLIHQSENNIQNEIIINFYLKNIAKIRRKPKELRIPYAIRMFRNAGFTNETIKKFFSQFKKQLLEL